MNLIFEGASCAQKFIHIVVRGNNLADKIVFVLRRHTPDGLDLAEFRPYVKLENRKTMYFDKDSDVETEIGEETVRIKYRLRRKTTIYDSFDIQLQFEKSDELDIVVWQTETVNFTLSKTIDADKKIAQAYPSIIQDLSSRVEKIESQTININKINGGKP